MHKNKKIIICKFNLKNKCKFGEKCKHRHLSLNELNDIIYQYEELKQENKVLKLNFNEKCQELSNLRKKCCDVTYSNDYTPVKPLYNSFFKSNERSNETKTTHRTLKYVNPRIKTDHLTHDIGNNETNPEQIRQICLDIMKPMQDQLDKNKFDIAEQRDALNKVKIQITDLGEKIDNKLDALDKSLANKVETLEKTFNTFEKQLSAKIVTMENTMTTNIQTAQFSIIGSIENLFKTHSLNLNKASSSTPSVSMIGQLQNNNLTPMG